MNLKNFKNYFIVAALATLALSSCKSKFDDEDPIVVKQEVVLEGQITSTQTLDANKTYLLRGYVRVMNNASLTIPAGTLLKGEKNTKGALIIEKGGKIFANGTATSPIVFTSDQTVNSRNIGDWSGVVICGKAPVNTADGTGTYEGGVLGAGIAEYGGTVANDNSGIFKYVRIEFAGIAIQTDKEINSLTLCGVGNGTQIDHVQVSFGGDDGFEFFGGTVNATHLIAYRCTDDDFDFDNGYNGKLQYGISIKDPNVADLIGTSRGIEDENKGTPFPSTFISRPVISNFTFIGPGTSSLTFHGANVHFGLNSKMILANSIIVNARTVAIEANTEVPAGFIKDGSSIISDNIVFGNTANYGLKDVTVAFANVAAFDAFALTKGNTVVASLSAAGFTSTSLDNPVLTISSGSAANNKAKFTGDLATGFSVTSFAGAMGTTDWTTGWASWSPKTNVY
jgi:hypothetical protein